MTTPTVDNPSSALALGKGELYFAPFVAGTQNAGGERFLGNCPEFTISQDDERISHYSSTRGIKKKDEDIPVEQTYSGTVNCDQITKENLAIFLLGSASVLTEAGATGETDNFTGVAQGLFYQLGVSATSPSGVRKVASVVVTDGEASPTTYNVGDDYTVDADLGRIYIVPGGAIADDSNIEVTYNITAHTRDMVVSSADQVEGALRFISYNPKGQRLDYFFPWVKWSPNGDFNLITDEWQSIPLSIEALRKGDLAAVYLDGRPVTS